MTLSLAEEINAATKLHHTALNQVLLQVLPLALPPKTSKPRLYAYGISHFLPIYSAFESEINVLIQSQPPINPLLRRLQIPGLERSHRLESDLKRLLSPSCLQTLNSLDKYGNKVDAHRKDDGSGMLFLELATFVARIRESIRHKPHLYLSYTWVLYMAIFSGGRYIRSKLKTAGDDFWATMLPVESGKDKYGSGGAAISELETWPLSFWNFSGSSDGEDLKSDYKSRFGEIERILTLKEREEIIIEATNIMESLLKIVRGIQVAVAEGVAEEVEEGTIGSEMCPSHRAENNSRIDGFYQSLGTNPVARDPSFSTLLCKHLLPMGMVDLFAGIKNAILFSAGRTSKVQVAVPVKSDRANI
ncbi:heme oxygenase [Pseudocyphellaria aurata]|nr:heme oxygenase [Pseudocyphellaria aurata]